METIFQTGDVVFLKSDRKKTPMVIADLKIFRPNPFPVFDVDEQPHPPLPVCLWLNSQSKLERQTFDPKVLVKLEED